MERVIHKYFDKMEDLEERLSDEVESLIAKIDIKAIMTNPLEELTAIASIVKDKMEDEYQMEAFNAGKKLAKDIQ